MVKYYLASHCFHSEVCVTETGNKSLARRLRLSQIIAHDENNLFCKKILESESDKSLQRLKTASTMTKLICNASDRAALLQERNKSGIYCWLNLVNGTFYIGSAKNLHNRLSRYYRFSYHQRNAQTYIVRSLLAHGFSNFEIWLVEYCDPADLLKREQFYLDLLRPRLNNAKTAGNTLGVRHTEEAKIKISKNRLGFKHTDMTRQRMSLSSTGSLNPFFGKV